MKKLLQILSIIFIASACSTNNDSHADEKTGTQDSPDSFKQKFNSLRFDYNKADSKFKFKDISTIDSTNEFNFDKPDRSLLLSEKEYYEALQDSNLEYYDADLNNAFYYSKQKDFKNFKRYIFATIDENIGYNYIYNIYDTSGKKTSSFAYKGFGGDGGWWYHLNTKKENENTFIQTNIDCEGSIDSAGNNVSVCDSIITKFMIKNDGSLQEISLGKFTLTL